MTDTTATDSDRQQTQDTGQATDDSSGVRAGSSGEQTSQAVGGNSTTRTDGGADAPLLVVSLEESAGKTAIALALARHAAEGGADVGYMKPKGTRLQSNVGKTLDEDPLLARTVLDLEAELHDLEPIVYSPTFIEQAIRGREDPAELRERVREAATSLSADRDRLFLEGGGRLDQGAIVNLTDPDVAALLEARVLLVATYRTPGDVDDVLRAAAAFGDRFAGVIFNAVADATRDQLETEVAPFLESRGVPVHGVLPHERTLSGVTVESLADELGGQVLADDGLDAYVERFAVGAMGADSALRHFRRTKNAAVITGGDRADIHAAALEAPGVNCLILTGGHRPSGAILGQAAQKGVPVIAVQTDTLSTVERAEDVVRGGRVRDEETVARMGELLVDHADLESLV